MADIIQLLPDHVANQIAAGEVVQRPASVVKELLENAIDAGATDIAVVVKDAGKTLVQVTDNGNGMSMLDARLCFERHATSKIKSADDLFNLHTKGFRGEALASIAAVAHVELQTKTTSEETGTKIVIEGSEVKSQQPEVTPVGTSVAVKNLFYNIPARRNFLKSDAVESRHIIDEFHRVALAHPNVSLRLISNGSDVFNLSPSSLRKRVVAIFGGKTDEKLVPVQEETEIVKVDGFVLKPEFARKSRGEQFFFVNHRFIKSPYLHHAVKSAFEGLVKEGTHPGYFLFLDLDPKSIDINIHPTKTEIKFDDEHSIYAMLRATVKHSLGQFSIAPVLDFKRDSELDTPYDYTKRSPVMPGIEVDKDFNPFKKGQGNGSEFKKDRTANWESLYVGLKDLEDPDRPGLHDIELESEEVTGSLFEQRESEMAAGTFQLQYKYIISPIKSGLLVIHQNLAHQRILYEELLKNITIQEGVSQQLLFPIELSFPQPDLELLLSQKEQLEYTGFVFGTIESGSIEISGIPPAIADREVHSVLESVVDDLRSDVPDSGFSQNDALAKSLARSMAIPTGTALNRDEQEHLVHQLFACKAPSVSPDNKPVLLTLDVTDLDKKFS